MKHFTPNEPQIQALLAQRSELVIRKAELETKMAAIKNLIRSGGRLPNDKYKQCCDAQTKHKGEILEVFKKMQQINVLISGLRMGATPVDVAAPKAYVPQSEPITSSKDVSGLLEALRDHCATFSRSSANNFEARQAVGFVKRELDAILSLAKEEP